MRHGLVLALLAVILGGEQARPCVITSFSPAQSGAGSTVILTGQGFTGASTVEFQEMVQTGQITMAHTSVAASFVVISDTQMSVTVPTIGPLVGNCYITVITNAGLTVTTDPTMTFVGSGTTWNSSTGQVVYVETGGTATNNGANTDTYYVKSGGTVNGSGGGSNVAYAEPGANVTASGVSVVQVAAITDSPVSSLFQYQGITPVAATGSATNISFNSATANGTVNPNASIAYGYFQYGTSTSYGSQTSTQGPIFSMSPVAVTATLSGLTPNTVYHFRMVATTGSVFSYGADQTFTTAALNGPMPGVIYGWPSGISSNAVTVAALVNPNAAATTAYFQYGLSANYGTTTTGTAIGNGTNDVRLQTPLTGLAPNTTYHYCVVASSEYGTTYGADQTFQTGVVGIAGISPAQAGTGATLTLTGVGFTGATSVLFQQVDEVPGYNIDYESATANFVVTSDTTMSVTVPDLGARSLGCYITVITSAGLTVTLDPAATVCESGNTVSIQGGASIYVESGGVGNGEGGSDTFYVRNGGSVNSSGGGGNVAYAEPGAIVQGVGVVTVPQISESPVAVLFQYAQPAPLVTTGSATNVEFTDAIANGTVNPNGVSMATAYVQYGTDLTYGSQSAAQDVDYSMSAVPVSVNLTKLAPGTLYHYRMVATNAGGTTYGGDQTFTTGAVAGGSPGVLNVPASGITYGTANLNAIVDPDGAATNVYFLYGLTGVYGSTTQGEAVGNGNGDSPVGIPIAGLLANTTYHYRIVATNVNGTTYGADDTFQTGAAGITGFSPAQAAAGTTLTLFGIGFTGATSVEFEQGGVWASASFLVVSDTEMTVTVPTCGFCGGGYCIIVATNAGVTVTIDPTVGVVENGGLASPGGSATVFVEGGGVASNNGSGSDTYFVKNGGLVNGAGGGGGNVAYAEPGATITLPGASVVSVPEISQSPIGALFDFLAPSLVTTGSASNVAIYNAATNGTVNPEGSDTTVYFEYGAGSSAGSQTASSRPGSAMPALTSTANASNTDPDYTSQTPSQSIGSGTSDLAVAANLSNLSSNTVYHYRLVASNGGGTTYGADQIFTTSTSAYDTWSASQFTAAQLADPAVGGPTAAPAGDGVPNILKYVFGVTPWANAAGCLPVEGSAVVNGTNCVTFTYTRMDSAADLVFQPEWSSDLATWSATGITETIISDNGTSQQVQDSIPMGGASTVFLRLQVTMP